MQLYFKATKKIFKPIIQKIARGGKGREDLLESAFFAYAHRNPVIDKIFWGRLKAVEQYIRKRELCEILDFGCGSGVLSYNLGQAGLNVVATDTDPVPFREVKKFIQFPAIVKFVPSLELDAKKYPGRFDAIVALDVLEHIEDTDNAIDFLVSLLKPDGEIIVSGPTENFLYKIGRCLAGKEFTGTYHKTDIKKIRKLFEKRAEVRTIKKIYPFLPLFDSFSALLVGFSLQAILYHFKFGNSLLKISAQT